MPVISSINILFVASIVVSISYARLTGIVLGLRLTIQDE